MPSRVDMQVAALERAISQLERERAKGLVPTVASMDIASLREVIDGLRAPAPTGQFTAADKQACAEREVRQRQHVYPRRIEAGKMTRELADGQIALMSEIRDDYAASAKKELLI